MMDELERIRRFYSGATRDTADDKLDYARFLSPWVIRRYCEYLQKHRVQSDGNMREPDNWKKGIPVDVYLSSLMRHVHTVWEAHQTDPSRDIQEELCAVIFNAMGWLYETRREDNE